jgi:hypothetical protein
MLIIQWYYWRNLKRNVERIVKQIIKLFDDKNDKTELKNYFHRTYKWLM